MDKEPQMTKIATLLLVDDSEEDRLLLRRKFKEFGLNNRLYTASNTADARAILKKHCIDVAFVDVHMPGENGIEFIADIKRKGLVRFAVIVSGTEDRKTKSQAYASGVDDFLTKDNFIEQLTAFCSVIKGMGLSIVVNKEKPKRKQNKILAALASFMMISGGSANSYALEYIDMHPAQLTDITI